MLNFVAVVPDEGIIDRQGIAGPPKQREVTPTAGAMRRKSEILRGEQHSRLKASGRSNRCWLICHRTGGGSVPSACPPSSVWPFGVRAGLAVLVLSPSITVSRGQSAPQPLMKPASKVLVDAEISVTLSLTGDTRRGNCHVTY